MHIFRHFFRVKMHIFHEGANNVLKKARVFCGSGLHLFIRLANQYS